MCRLGCAPRLVVILLAPLWLSAAVQPDFRLGAPEAVAPGIELFRVDQRTWKAGPEPISIQMLRLDPRRVELRLALAHDRVMGLESVPDIAARHGARAAINAGFFLPTGDPAALLKVDGELVSETPVPRGAVAWLGGQNGMPQHLLFDQVSTSIDLGWHNASGATAVHLDAVNTLRPPGRLVWFSPRFFDHTDTVDTGTEWIFRGTPLVLTERRDCAMRTTIPRDGAVLSWAGSGTDPRLDGLVAGNTVSLLTDYHPVLGTSPAAWSDSQHAVSGAGLLIHDGRPIRDWSIERLRSGFDTERHPRTMIGVDTAGFIWLVTVDGRNPALSLGMTFADLQALGSALGLCHALNLDGGGSTTMVVDGRVINHPSDPTGPRRVSDAILVFVRSNHRIR